MTNPDLIEAAQAALTILESGTTNRIYGIEIQQLRSAIVHAIKERRAGGELMDALEEEAKRMRQPIVGPIRKAYDKCRSLRCGEGG